MKYPSIYVDIGLSLSCDNFLMYLPGVVDLSPYQSTHLRKKNIYLLQQLGGNKVAVTNKYYFLCIIN